MRINPVNAAYFDMEMRRLQGVQQGLKMRMIGAIRSALSVVEAGVACAILSVEAIRLVSLGPPTMWNTLVLAQSRARASTRLERETAQILRELTPALLSVS